MEMHVNLATKKLLTSLGWSEDRYSDATPYLKVLASDGYPDFFAARSFLENFGGLRGVVPAFKAAGKFDSIHFDPALAIENVYRERVEEYEKRIHEDLVVVGEAYNAHLTLLLSRSGRFFGASDDYLCWIGDNAAEAMNNIFDLRDFRELKRAS